MEKIKTNSGFKKFRKILFRTIVVLILLLLLIGISLSLPYVQTKIAHYATDKINKEYGTNINIDEVAITVFGGVKMKKVLILDHHKDTLIYAKRIKTTILDFKNLIDGKLQFGDLHLDNFELNIVNYKKEKETNLDKFIAAFDDGKPGSGKFLFQSSNVYIKESRFSMMDYNRENPKDIDFTQLNANLKDFKIKGADVSTSIKQLSFKDHRGLFVKNLIADFTYNKKMIGLENLNLETKESVFKGKVILSYNRDNKDFSNFNNKVIFDINIEESFLSTNDIRYFYKEIGENQTFFLDTKLKGTLNDFYLTDLYLLDKKNSVIKGDINLKNLFSRSPGAFYMKGDFNKITSNYSDLTKLLPNILGKKLPSSLQKFGQFTFVGNTELSQKYINANFLMNTALGIIESDLQMTDIDAIDNAKYKGNVILDGFNVGALLNRKDIGKVSLNLSIDGKGFTQKLLNTTFVGDVDRVTYNGYTYTKIIVDGSFKQPIFKGKVYINDPNLFMDFNGLVDLGKKATRIDFQTKIDYANLQKLNFITDSISIFKGDLTIKANGNSIDNMIGDVVLTNASYQNKKDTYYVDFLNVNSVFDEKRERTITITSDDAIEGSVVGKFQFNQLLKVVENSLGSLYTNYKPNKVRSGQYIKFNFTIFSKIIEIFYPDISIATNTILKGNISSEAKDFKLTFNSPKIKFSDNEMDNILLKVDNQNPLYNTFIQMDSIKTKRYKIRDFSLINTISRDTLYFRTEFKGGKQGLDFYNLNLYHTINKENKNVVGFKKSEMQFKDYLWYLNEKEDEENNKIVFDKKLSNFSFENIILSHENQNINFSGTINGNNSKDLQLTFENVNLNKITPDVEKFKFDGNLNGKINFKQSSTVFQPTSTLNIGNLHVNDVEYGDLNLDISGDESLRKFYVNSSLDNKNVETFKASGNIEIVNSQTLLDLDFSFDNFNLGILGKIGGDVITNIRGFVSGNARIEGNVEQLDYNGRLFVNDTGLTIPYLNTDYKFIDNTIVDITENKFIIRETSISDTKFDTKGTLGGIIKHKQFEDWQLDLSINSNRLLALNTVDYEDAAFYGDAFFNGSANIKGPTSALMITVNGESAKGTEIKIPINDAVASDDNNYLHFLTPAEKLNKKKNKITENRNYDGLELDFNFTINNNANVEVILDRESGHAMKGKGNGTLLFRINTLGKFEMFGDFSATEGSYNFKYGGLIDKKFDVKKGSYIVWNGDPLAATLNLAAVYRVVGGANPAVLIDNPSFNKKVDVEVVIDVKGSLTNPEPDFTINFPNVGSSLRSELQYKLDDKDTRQIQALYLLSTGGFLSQDGVSQNQLSNNLFEKASSMFNDLFAGEDDKLQLGIEYVTGDNSNNPDFQTDARFGVSVSSKINDRITVNGKVGVPVGGITETAIVGDVEVQYRVNEDGTLNLRFFNKENDITYIGQGIGYTQGVGISYEVDFDTLKELINKIFKNAKIDKVTTNKSDDLHDSDIENIDLPNTEKKDKDKDKNNDIENPSPNREGIPVED